MRDVRTRVRKTVTWVVSGLATLVIVPIVSTYFTELAREHGFYENPSIAALNSLSAMVSFSQSFWGGLLIGAALSLLIAVWGDYWIKTRIEAQTLKTSSLVANKENDPKVETGILQMDDGELELYRAWDGVDPLTVTQAACLWGRQTPVQARFLSGSSRPRYMTIIQAAERAKIKFAELTAAEELKVKRGAYMELQDAKITRKELRRYIDDNDLRPAPFLFEEDRLRKLG